MKHVGIVGVTAEGASLCYKHIVSKSQEILGANKHPEITLNNSSFDRILEAQNERDWQKVAKIILVSIEKLKRVGADFVIIPANSVHFAFEFLSQVTEIPVLSIVSETAKVCKRKNFRKVLILGVGITMSEGLYNKTLENYGVTPVVPTKNEQKLINEVIYKELIKGVFGTTSTQSVLKIIKKYKKEGCEAVILGCTELPLVINDSNSSIPVLDTTEILAHSAAKKATS